MSFQDEYDYLVTRARDHAELNSTKLYARITAHEASRHRPFPGNAVEIEAWAQATAGIREDLEGIKQQLNQLRKFWSDARHAHALEISKAADVITNLELTTEGLIEREEYLTEQALTSLRDTLIKDLTSAVEDVASTSSDVGLGTRLAQAQAIEQEVDPSDIVDLERAVGDVRALVNEDAERG